MPRGRVLNPAAVEQVDQLRAQVCMLAVGPALHRACLELELYAAVRRHACWGPAQHVGVPDLERRKLRVVSALEAELRIRQAEGREVQHRAVLEPLHPVGKAAEVGPGDGERGPPEVRPRRLRARRGPRAAGVTTPSSRRVLPPAVEAASARGGRSVAAGVSRSTCRSSRRNAP